MKVSAVLLVTLFGIGLAAEVQHKRASEEYNTSTPKAATSGGSSNPSQDGQLKYQQPSYLFQSKALSYTPLQQLNYVVPQTYKYIPQPNLAQISYAPQQQQHSLQGASQQSAQYTPSQNVVYNTQSAIKSVPAPQKLAYSQEQPQIQQHQQQPQGHQQYSLATDVSSFKFHSPLVTYSNLGVIQQAVGKGAEQQQSSQQQYAHQTQQQPAAQQAYTSQQQEPQFLYKSKIQIPQLYSQAPQTFQTQKQPQVVYQQVAPKQAASVPQQLVYTVPQQYTYSPVQYVQQQSHTVPQPAYVIAPQYQAIPNYHQQPVQQ